MTSTPEFFEYRVVPDKSVVAFSVKHLMISKVKGRFERFSGTSRLFPGDPGRSEFLGTVEVGSVTTSDRARDEYLRTNEFFDPKRFPEMRFVSSGIRSFGRDEGRDGVRIAGTLRIKEVSAPVEFEVEGALPVPAGVEKPPAHFEIHARGRIDRRDFGLVWPPALEAGGVLVGNEVEIDLKIHWVRV